MAATNAHIVPLPAWTNLTGTARLVNAVLVLAFVAAACALFGGYTAFGFTLFTCCATLIICAYYIIALSYKVELYNKWAVLGLEIFGVIFWATSFSLCAEWTAAAHWLNDFDDTRYGYWNAPFSPESIGLISRSLNKRATNHWKAGVACGGVAAGLGALEFVLFLATLVIFSLNLHKHRLAHRPAVAATTSKASTTEPATTTAAPSVGKTEEPKTVATEEAAEPQVLRKDSKPVV